MKAPKLKPGSLPMRRPVPRAEASPHPAQLAPPPFPLDDGVPPPEEKEVARAAITKLARARRKVQELAPVVRDAAFEDWVRRFLSAVDDPREWTQARVLYENYLKRSRDFGGSRSGRRVSRQELASETQWGKMMRSAFLKKRRGRGWFYPVRLKQGA